MKHDVSDTAVVSMKADLRQMLPNVKSSHRIEAIARGLGWATNAAMRASLSLGKTQRTLYPDAFSHYLADRGCAAPGQLFFRVVLRAHVQTVMGKNPDLTHHGFGVYEEGRISESERQARFTVNRSEMLSDTALGEFERAVEFLSILELTSAPTSVFHSYNLKHSAERWHRRCGIEGRWEREYVSNGMLLAAAFYLGLRVRRASRTSFVGYLNVSTASVRAIADLEKPPLPQLEKGELFRAIGHNNGKFSYITANESRVVTLPAGRHTPSNLVRLAPLDYWVNRFPPRDRRAPFDTLEAASHLFRQCGEAGIFDSNRFRQNR
jgi:hypothetical protein